MRLPLGLSLAALIPMGCVRLDYFRISHFEPASHAILQRLEGSKAGLQQCLDALGAPLSVGELPSGIAVAYGWQDRGQWGFDVSFAFERFLSVRFNYKEIEDSLRGVLLVFDEELRLEAVRRGPLRDLTRQFRRRPAKSEELEK